MSSIPGPKLDDPARAKIYIGIVQGKTNAELNGMLVDMGCSSISERSMTTYRQSKEVRELIDAAVAEIRDVGLVSYRARILMLNQKMADLMALLGTYGVEEEVVGVDRETGEPITKKVDSRRTKDYNQKLLVLLQYQREMSRLVDRFETNKGIGGLEENTAPAPQNITTGQVQDAIEYLIRRQFPDRVKQAEAEGKLAPAAPHIARLLEVKS